MTLHALRCIEENLGNQAQIVRDGAGDQPSYLEASGVSANSEGADSGADF